MRSIVVAITIVIGIGGINVLGKIVSLIGNLCATPMAFVFPTGFHLWIMKPSLGWRIFDWTVMILGTIYMIFGTVWTIITWNDT